MARVPLAEVADAAIRFHITHSSGLIGTAFEVRGMVVSGSAAGLVAGILTLAGWEQPWDRRGSASSTPRPFGSPSAPGSDPPHTPHVPESARRPS